MINNNNLDSGRKDDLLLGLALSTPQAALSVASHVQHEKPNSLTLSLMLFPSSATDQQQNMSSSNCDDDISSFSKYSFVSVKKELRKDDQQLGGINNTDLCDDDDDISNTGAGSCRTKKKKLRLNKKQSVLLENSFKLHTTLNPKQKEALATQLNLRTRQVEVWFQNRRARTKLKQTEVDCEFLKKCCERLVEENEKLHKEIQYLKSLNKQQQQPLNMQHLPPTSRLSYTTSTNNNYMLLYS